jgi:hypothetical protein
MPLVRRDIAAAPGGSPPRGDPFADLSAPTAEARWAAARALHGRPGAVAALADALLREPDRRVREAIFASLSREATRESAEAVLPSLRSDDAELRTGGLDALRAMPAAAAMVLPALLGDPDSDVRLLSCELARVLSPAQASMLLARVLEREAEVNVCAAAVEVLAEAGDASVLPALARCARRFAHEPFLAFAVSVTSRRIAQSPRPRG